MKNSVKLLVLILSIVLIAGFVLANAITSENSEGYLGNENPLIKNPPYFGNKDPAIRDPPFIISPPTVEDPENYLGNGGDKEIIKEYPEIPGTGKTEDPIEDPVIPTPPQNGGGGGGSCNYNENYDWQCSAWTNCVDGTQTRECNNYNNCGNNYGRPEVTQTCTIEGTTEGETVQGENVQLAGITGAAIADYIGTGRGTVSLIALLLAFVGIAYFGVDLAKGMKK